LIDGHHPDRYDITHTDHVVWTLDIAIGKLADVHQAGVFQSNIDKCPEINHVEHGAFKLHAGR
jgi:hypothetical protein